MYSTNKINFPITEEILPRIPLQPFEVAKNSSYDIETKEVNTDRMKEILSQIDVSRIQTKRSNSGSRSYSNSELQRLIRELGGIPKGKKEDFTNQLLELINKSQSLIK